MGNVNMTHEEEATVTDKSAMPQSPPTTPTATRSPLLFAPQDYVPEDIGSISSFEPPQSPDSSYDNLHLSSEDYAKEPPLVPPLSQMTLLNVPATNMDIQPPMSRP